MEYFHIFPFDNNRRRKTMNFKKRFRREVILNNMALIFETI